MSSRRKQIEAQRSAQAQARAEAQVEALVIAGLDELWARAHTHTSAVARAWAACRYWTLRAVLWCVGVGIICEVASDE